MVKTALVTTDVAAGLEVVQALDRSDLSISVALWAYLSEYEDWRFLLASRRLDEAKSLAAYRDLRRTFAKAKSVEGMRMGGQLIGDRFVEDALVYRIR